MWMQQGCLEDKRQKIRRPLHSFREIIPQHSEHPPTHTSRDLHTKYLKCSGKTLFQKNASLKDFCWFDFAEMYKWSYFLTMTVALYLHAGYPGKQFHYISVMK